MRVVAMLNTEDQNGPNSKIIGVPKDEPRLSEYTAPPAALPAALRRPAVP
mgnify:FL=1